MTSVFISYRRRQSADLVGRLKDRLRGIYGRGQIFTDVDNIEPGQDFRAVIDQKLSACEVFLVVIGPRWTEALTSDDATDADQKLDYVRQEIESAFALNKLIIPIIAESSEMPAASSMPSSIRKLAFLNATKVRSDNDFERDVSRLVRIIDRNLPKAKRLAALRRVAMTVLSAVMLGALILLGRSFLDEDAMPVVADRTVDEPPSASTDLSGASGVGVEDYSAERVGSDAEKITNERKNNVEECSVPDRLFSCLLSGS